MRKPSSYSNLTLDEALVAFRKEHGLKEKYRTMSSEAQTLFARHDMVHVLWGLDTSLRQEASADGWTLLGTDMTFSEMREFFALPEEKELVQDVGWWAIVKGYLQALPDYVRIAWRSRRLTKRWRWSDNAAYRDRLVHDIRREFGIDAALS